jgi:hypothetical protein
MVKPSALSTRQWVSILSRGTWDLKVLRRPEENWWNRWSDS